MVDLAKVNPERSVVESAGAHTPAPVVAKSGRAAFVVSTVGRVIEQLSRLWGYGILISGIDSIFLSAVSSLPLTKWDDSGVPRANTFAVSVLIWCWFQSLLLVRHRAETAPEHTRY